MRKPRPMQFSSMNMSVVHEEDDDSFPSSSCATEHVEDDSSTNGDQLNSATATAYNTDCLLYTSDAADE